MQGNLVHNHTMANGIELTMREIPGFGERSEIGLFIGEKCIGSFIVDKMRSGNVMIKPTMMKAIKLVGGKEVDNTNDDNDTSEEPSLTDIAGEQEDE